MRLRIAVIAAVAVFVFGCATAEPKPPLAGNLTEREIETVIADSMMATASHLFRLISDSRIDEVEGEIVSDSAIFTWSDADMRNTKAVIHLEMDNHKLRSALFDDYRGYVFSGTIDMILMGDRANLKMDLTSSHSNPDRYPVTSLVVDLSNLEDTIRPENVQGFITANGFDVPVAAVVKALEVGD